MYIYNVLNEIRYHDRARCKYIYFQNVWDGCGIKVIRTVDSVSHAVDTMYFICCRDILIKKMQKGNCCDTFIHNIQFQ